MLQAAEGRYQEAARLSAGAAALAARAWESVSVDNLDGWRPQRLASQVTALQLAVAGGATDYLAAVLTEQNIDAAPVADLEPRAFAGVAGDGRPLLTLLDEPRIAAKTAIGQGVSPQQAWQSARSSLRLMSVTAVQDAGRAADSVGLVARPRVGGYVRMLNTPSCARCVLLAGKFYRWNTGFQRHPRCDCRHVPSNEDVAGDLRTDPLLAVRSGQVTGLSRADSRAILEDNADVGQVVNAHRGMSTGQVYGRNVKITSEGITKRGLAGVRMGNFEQNVARDEGQRYRRSKTVRLRPESIYRIAGDDREEALRLLRRFGYLI